MMSSSATRPRISIHRRPVFTAANRRHQNKCVVSSCYSLTHHYVIETLDDYKMACFQMQTETQPSKQSTGKRDCGVDSAKKLRAECYVP